MINPSVDSIQEFKIQKSLYAAEFGGKASALINVATKSGGNRAHGSLYGFARNDRFDAHNYFDDPKRPVPPLKQNQLGFSLGGPIRRNRTFFFTQLRRPANPPIDYPHVFGADNGGASRRSFGRGAGM